MRTKSGSFQRFRSYDSSAPSLSTARASKGPIPFGDLGTFALFEDKKKSGAKESPACPRCTALSLLRYQRWNPPPWKPPVITPIWDAPTAELVGPRKPP